MFRIQGLLTIGHAISEFMRESPEVYCNELRAHSLQPIIEYLKKKM